MHSVAAPPLSGIAKNVLIHKLKGWCNSFNHFNANGFKKTKTLAFLNGQVLDVKGLTAFYKIYKPLLAFCKDSSRFLDIYSYPLNIEKTANGYQALPDIDQAIYLYDRNANYWNRILFLGNTEFINDATWLTDTTFLLVGIDKNNDARGLPVIYLGNVNTHTLVLYKNDNKACYQKSDGYASPRLKAMHIKGL